MATLGVKERYNTFVKSETDPRVYRGLLLTNGLNVLLVSDPTTIKSAAGLEVQVGTFSDPDDIPGMAHLCQKTLFLGTEKYPEEDAFQKLVSEYSGYLRAVTCGDRTAYFFDVLSSKLCEALDMFAQFFISPLFPKSSIDREINAIHSEYEYYKSSDECPMIQLKKNMADPKHPFSRFNIGNKETLKTIPESKGIDVRTELLEFHKKWYSANIMSLVVVGKESLDELEAMVAPLFSAIEDNAVMAPSWPEHPFPQELRGKKLYGIPIMDFHYISIDFPTHCTRKDYKTRPGSYLSNLIGHEGPGSLLSAFKKRGWCYSVRSGTRVSIRGFGLFAVEVDLTEEGINITLTKLLVSSLSFAKIFFYFQYIAMLKAQGPQYWIWEEQKNLMEVAFRFKDVLEPRTVVGHTVDLLKDYPLEDVLSFDSLQTEWKPESINALLSLFKPENAIVNITSKMFEDKCTMTERWYGTKYWVENIDECTLKKWNEGEISKELHLPAINEFIPWNLKLEKNLNPEDLAPEIIKDTKLMRIWYQKDTEFCTPKAKISFKFISPLANADPHNANLTQMLVELLVDSLQEVTYPATLAGLDWSVSCTNSEQDGVNVTVGGYDDKIDILLYKIMDHLVSFKVDPESFSIMKQKRIRDLKNLEADQPIALAIRQEVLCLTSSSWTSNQILAAAQDMTPEQLQVFAAKFIRKVHIEGLMYGNLSRERAIKMADSVEARFPKDGTPLVAEELLLNRSIELDKGTWYIHPMYNNIHTSSCASLFYACGVYQLRENLILNVLSKIFEERCYNTLKTQEQLGCLVRTKACVYSRMHGLRVTVQSDKHPEFLEKRIEEFVQGFVKYLQEINEEELSIKLEKPRHIYSKARQIWSEIRTQMYIFDRASVEGKELNTITKEELMHFYMKHICAESPERQKLSIYIISTIEGGANRNETITSEKGLHEKYNPTADKKVEIITDLGKFKCRRNLYPNPIPFSRT